EREQWDTNHDGFIDLNEFKAYAKARLQKHFLDRAEQGFQPGTNGSDQQAAPLEATRKPAGPPRGAATTSKDLPKWFEEIDVERTGQIALHQWKAAGRPIDEFLRMDRNGDGFLTEDEVRFYLAQEGN